VAGRAGFDSYNTNIECVAAEHLKRNSRVRGQPTNRTSEVTIMLNILDSDRPGPPNSAAALGMVGQSSALHETLELAQKAARSDANILLCGESGTGKNSRLKRYTPIARARASFRCGGLRIFARESARSRAVRL